MKSLSVFYTIVVLCIGIVACKQGVNDKQPIDFDSIDISSSKNLALSLDTIGQGLPIFYNMYLSVELSSLFKSTGAVFKSNLMNSPDRISEYITSYQQAVNIGIYAVDLSYARVFDQVEIAASYFSAMQNLSTNLGIPADYFENTAARFEKNISNKDSLISIANEVYMTTDKYLKENERYTTSALIILGGWVEAVQIGLDVAIESKDSDIIEKLVDQKYSLNNLMIMLSEYKDSEIVKEYLVDLQHVKKEFDTIVIPFDANFDSQSTKGKEQMTGVIKQIQKLKVEVTNFRTKLIK